jgi:hypothetical protein
VCVVAQTGALPRFILGKQYLLYCNPSLKGHFIMHTRNIFAMVIVALFSLTLLGCGATSSRESTGEYVDDTVITTKVKAAIFNDPSLKVSEINVETFKGTVQLSGFVSSAAHSSTATRLAREIKGVTAVKNDIRIK